MDNAVKELESRDRNDRNLTGYFDGHGNAQNIATFPKKEFKSYIEFEKNVADDRQNLQDAETLLNNDGATSDDLSAMINKLNTRFNKLMNSWKEFLEIPSNLDDRLKDMYYLINTMKHEFKDYIKFEKNYGQNLQIAKEYLEAFHKGEKVKGEEVTHNQLLDTINKLDTCIQVVSLLTIGSKLGEKWVQERSPVAMEEMQVAEIGSFCLNEAYEDYQKVHHENMIKYGKTDKGVRRYFCKTCKKSFTETKGTMFYRCRHTEEEIVECMSILGDRNSLAAIHRVKGIKEETVAKWLEKSADHIKQFEHIIRKKKLNRVQLDALWTYFWHNGEKVESLKKLQEEIFGVAKPSTWTVV